MNLEKINFSDKYNLVILTIEGEDFSISYNMYNDLNLSIDQDINFATYKDILAEDQFNEAKNMALSKISYSQKTSFEIEKSLKDNNFTNDSISRVIDFLNEYGLIDDELYVKSYVSDKHNISRWSKNKIRYSLRAKNITDSLIEDNLSEISDEQEYGKAYNFAKKKTRNDYSDKNKQKVYRYLASKGFEFDIVNKVIGDIFKWLMDMFIF